MKIGAPITAVTTPTGTSEGARMMRERRSHKTRYVAPARNEAGSNNR